MTSTDVIIVGAGPTGLALAIWLTKQHVKVRIIDKASQGAISTRALAVQSRILELYSQIGLGHTVVDRGLPMTRVHGWIKGRHSFHVPVANAAVGMTEFPFVTIMPQHEHEALLRETLSGLGVDVEMDTELVTFEDNVDTATVTATIKRNGVSEIVTSKFIAGCDGSHSVVRKDLGIEFPGGVYDQMFYVADIEGSGPAINGELNVCLDNSDFLAIFPLAGTGRARIIGTIRQSSMTTEAQSRTLTFDDVGHKAIDQMKLQISKINWFSPHHVHHRVANHFRKGRAFLVGDAAHVHSPAGGQGMNTGIGDAINLAWKLAAVIQGKSQDGLLDTYEEERRAFALRLVATTDRIFSGATAEGWFREFIRTRILPWVLPILFSFQCVQRFQFRTVSQISLNYRGMSLSRGKVGKVQAGERLPWVLVDGQSNYEPLKKIQWQIHVYGEPNSGLRAWCADQDLPLVVFQWRSEYRSAGLTRDAAYLLRPDTYVAFAGESTPEHLRKYFDEQLIRP